MHALEIEGQTDQTPFARGGKQAAQGELTKAQHFFDEANHRLDGTLSQAIDGLTDLRLKLVRHFDLRAGVLRWRDRPFREQGLPTLMMQFPTCGDVGFNATS